MITNSLDLKKMLASKGINPTHQRLKILKYIQESRRHPTADMIYQALVKEMPTISKTTVYNTINTFLKKGIVLPMTITGTEVHVDYITTPHHHLLCEKCGGIIDVEVMCPNLHKEVIAGHRIKELHGYFKGICAHCISKEKIM